jgi:hypothetical protein
MSARDGGPAFPRPHSWDESPLTGMHEGDRTEPYGAQSGMSLRDYFAAAALQAPWFERALAETPRDAGATIGQHAAAIAYAVAQRMLVERAQ